MTAKKTLPELREDRIRELLRSRDHMEDCPGIDGVGRVEAYDLTQPPDPRAGRLQPRDVLVVRCLECAGQRVLEDGSHATLIEEAVL